MSCTTYYCLILVAIATLWYYFWDKARYWTKLGVKQMKAWPLIGNHLPVFLRRCNVAELIKIGYDAGLGERYCGMYMFVKPVLLLRDAELIKQITVRDFDSFTDHGSFLPADIDRLWSKNLLALCGKPWHDMRTTLTPSFTSAKMRGMFGLMSETADNYSKHFQKLTSNGKTLEINMKDGITRYTNDVIASTAFGVQVDSFRDPNNEFYLMGKRVTNFTGLPTFLKLLLFNFSPKLYKFLGISFFGRDTEHFFVNLVGETLKLRREKNIVRPDMIHLLMEAQSTAKSFSDFDVAAQALVFFFAGFESGANALCFLTYELALNPDIQTRLREEVRQELNGSLTYEKLANMKYLEQVVTETLRKYPVAIMTDRICVKPYTIEPSNPQEKPVQVKVGDTLWLPLYGLHHDPNNFENPSKFDPERFNEENKGKVDPYVNIPFGIGQRGCIGARYAQILMKTLVCEILRKFELVPTEKTQIPMVLSRSEFKMTPQNGFWMGLKPLQEPF